MVKLYIMVGLSGSGKSTIAKELAKDNNALIVSSDEIRAELSFYEDQTRNEEVFKIFHKRIRDNLKAGINTIADATNITIKSRKSIIENARKYKCEIIAYVVAKPFWDCMRDNLNRKHPVPGDILKKQIKCYQIPFYEEGINEIIIEHTNNYFPVIDITNIMIDFDQKTKWHQDTLDVHCNKVNERFRGKYPGYELATLFHDCGKPYCQTFDEEGQAHYYGHESIGAYILLTYFQTATLDDLFLVNYHMMPFNWIEEKTHKKYKHLFGEYKYNMLKYFNECDKSR